MKAAGNLSVIELPPIRSWDPRTGDTNIRRWTGPSTLIGPSTTPGTKAYALKAAGIRHQIEEAQPGRFPIISATYGADDTQPPNEALSDDWDLDGSRLEKELWELPKVQRVMDFFKDATGRAAFRSDFEALLRGERTTLTSDGEETSLTLKGMMDALRVGVSLGGGNGNAAVTLMQEMFAERAKGVSVFPYSIFVLRRTRVLAQNTSIRPAYENLNRIFTRQQMFDWEKVPANTNVTKFALPAGFYLKNTPTCKKTGPDKWTLTQDYEWCDYYSNFALEKAIAPPPTSS